jgi:hypothetical protein
MHIEVVKININPTYFVVHTPSSGSLQVVSAKVMNYWTDKVKYSSTSFW